MNFQHRLQSLTSSVKTSHCPSPGVSAFSRDGCNAGSTSSETSEGSEPGVPARLDEASSSLISCLSCNSLYDVQNRFYRYPH